MQASNTGSQQYQPEGVFHKSTFSASQNCVEVARFADKTVQVRDSKHIHGTTLTFNQNEWRAFLEGMRTGEFTNQKDDGAFRKSAHSGGGNCVEVAKLSNGIVQVRDSKDENSPVLTFNSGEWQAFLKGIRAGEFAD